jgi:hypothetical protein
MNKAFNHDKIYIMKPVVAPSNLIQQEIFNGIQPNHNLPPHELSLFNSNLYRDIYDLSKKNLSVLDKIDKIRNWMLEADSQLGEIIIKENLNTFEAEQLVHRIFGDGQYLRQTLYNFVRRFPIQSNECVSIISEELALLNIWCATFAKVPTPLEVYLLATGLKSGPEQHRYDSFLRVGHALNDWSKKMEALLTYTELFVMQALSTATGQAA